MEGYIPILKAVPPWTADNHFLSLACISVCCASFLIHLKNIYLGIRQLEEAILLFTS